MAPPDKSQYGKLSFTESLGLLAAVIRLPAALLWSVTTTAFASWNSERTVKRIIVDCALRYVCTALSVRQQQSVFGTTRGMYDKWTKVNKLSQTIDEVGEDARLFWIGPKRLGKVVLFMHGGAFLLPATDFSLSFWRYAQLELEKQNIEVGFALLNYSLAPYSPYPTQLKQAATALQFLLDAGVKPENLILTGDSAGGNLIVQVLSQILHPLPGIPTPRLERPLRGVYLISPWASLSATSASHKANTGRDFLSERTLAGWGTHILADVPPAEVHYVEAVRAPADWFAGIDRCTERALITAGSAECLRDDIVAFGEAFKKHLPNTELVVQKDGFHEDMFLDFALPPPGKLSSMTPLTLEWLAAGFS